MPHIPLPDGIPGIVGLLNTYPDSAEHLTVLAQTVLRGPSSLTPAERELIASIVSNRNECFFCATSHAAAARHLYGDQCRIVDDALERTASAGLSQKMQALLAIAEKVRRDGRLVTADDVAAARRAGADDQAIHDTVLIAAMFSMYNRYVDGLATWTPRDPALYDEMGERLATQGYIGS